MAMWISRFLGPVILLLGIPMVVTPESLQDTTRSFLADSPLVLVSGVLALTAGLAIVNTHNVWVLDWTLIVTVFGWMLVLGGAARIVAPRVVSDVGGAMMHRPTTTVFHSEEGEADGVGVAVGAFADPACPAPAYSIYDCRRHPCVQLARGTTAFAKDPV